MPVYVCVCVSVCARACACVILAGSITRDIYVVMANLPGLQIGVYMTVTAYGFADLTVCVTLLSHACPAVPDTRHFW